MKSEYRNESEQSYIDYFFECHKPELKSCPFCGEDEIITCHPYHGNFYIMCCCGVSTDCHEAITLSIDAWNSRMCDVKGG